VFYYVLKYVLLGPLLRLLFRPRAEGLEHVPAMGAAIVAGNHLSFADPLLMPAVLKRRITFLAKAEYFTAPGLTGRLTALVLRGAGQISVDRSGRAAGQAAIREGLGVLAKGELLAIYPEGTRSPDGRLYKGKVGVAVMALAAQVPVIRARWWGPSRSGLRDVSCPGSDRSRSVSGNRWTSRALQGWRTTRRCCGPSPTRLRSRSCGSRARSTWIGTRPT
jgi:1-acyl-sn-glycerol-3-phosphate acyltransferase